MIPRDPNWFKQRRQQIPAARQGQTTGYNLYERAFHDIRYRAANAVFVKRFPHYRSHRPFNGLKEYAGLANRALRAGLHARHAEQITRELVEAGKPYYVFPLQLNSDAQILVHSPFEGVREAIAVVLRSFAIHAPKDAILVVKNHPLDTGLVDYRDFANRIAEQYDFAKRMRFIDSGHLPTLLDRAQGAVVVNSTVGLSALHHRLPLIALGNAIYGLSGLTWQGSLDDFWQHAQAPDQELYHAFLDYLIHHTQINGDFYTQTGIEMAVAGAVRRLEANECE